MSIEISADDLNRIIARWSSYDIPMGAPKKINELGMKAVNNIFDMILLLGDNTDYTLGKELGSIVIRPFLLCYFIGYELASRKMSRADGTLYLIAATDPIDNFALNILGILVAKGIISQEKGMDMASGFAWLLGEASNDICIFGIENFRKIGYR